MPRPTKFRRVEFLPEVTVFKPAGVPLRALEEVVLTVEELEALRLKDLEDLEQEQCAERMQVSRPTFQRVLESARRKVAEALTRGKAVRIEGGTYRVAMRRFRCPKCEQEFEEPYGTGQRGMDMSCPRCGAPRVYRVDGDTPRDPSLPGPDERPHGWHGRGRGFGGPSGPRGPQEKA